MPDAIRTRRQALATGAILLLAVAAIGVAQTGAGRRALTAVGLYAPSQPYTELYFGVPSAIALATRGELRNTSATKLTFVVANRTHSRRRYRWTIRSQGVTRAAGSTVLSPSGTRWVVTHIATGCPPGVKATAADGSHAARPPSPKRVRVDVRLVAPAESIRYWLECHE